MNIRPVYLTSDPFYVCRRFVLGIQCCIFTAVSLVAPRITSNKDTIMVLIDNHERIPLKDFTEKAYLDYSMYVILDRALPNIAD